MFKIQDVQNSGCATSSTINFTKK